MSIGITSDGKYTLGNTTGSTPVYRGKRQSDEQILASQYRDDFARFQSQYMPLIKEQMGTLNDNSIIKRGLADADTVAERSRAMNARDSARYGLGMSKAQRDGMNRASELKSTATIADTENNARLDQMDRNRTTALALAGQGVNLRGQGMDELMQSVGLAGNRNRANAASAAQARQQNMGTAMALASMAFMM